MIGESTIENLVLLCVLLVSNSLFQLVFCVHFHSFINLLLFHSLMPIYLRERNFYDPTFWKMWSNCTPMFRELTATIIITLPAMRYRS